jgi:RNA polymerase sigma factor (sigma-70 family)
MWPLRRKPTPNLESTPERELIELARGSSGAAIQEIMRRNNRRLFRAARGIVGSDWEAEEIVQDAYVRAFRGLEAFRQEAALGTWLTRIVINEAQGRLRGRRETLPLTAPIACALRSNGPVPTDPCGYPVGAARITLLFVQIVLLQELGPESLRRRVTVRPTLGREVHQVPVRPHRVDVVHHRLGAPEMKNLAVPLREGMHHRLLHILGLSLAFVVGLI